MKSAMTQMKRAMFVLGSAGMMFQGACNLPDNFWATEVQLAGDGIVAGSVVALWDAFVLSSIIGG